MKQLETVTRIELRLSCFHCGAFNGPRKTRKFCIECGTSLEKQVQVNLCPFCGDEMDSHHFDIGCDEVREIKFHREDFIAQDPDGDFWYTKRQYNYSERDGFHLSPLPPTSETFQLIKNRIEALFDQVDALAPALRKLQDQYQQSKGEPTNGST